LKHSSRIHARHKSGSFKRRRGTVAFTQPQDCAVLFPVPPFTQIGCGLRFRLCTPAQKWASRAMRSLQSDVRPAGNNRRRACLMVQIGRLCQSLAGATPVLPTLPRLCPRICLSAWKIKGPGAETKRRSASPCGRSAEIEDNASRSHTVT
jgi:hypothetical protein